MSIPKAVRAKRKSLASQLTRLGNLLFKTEICDDITPITDAARDLNSENLIVNPLTEAGDRNLWGYEIRDLSLKFRHNPKHLMPKDIHDLTLQLNVSVYGEILDSIRINDPFIYMGISIVLIGDRAIKREDGEVEVIKVISSFHLDRDKDTDSEEPHPSYHFQFGGRNMRDLKKNEESYGHLMVLDIPRINHYPMEGILAIDFVLSNFFHKTWGKLIQNGEYLNLVAEKQDLCIKPYFQALANKWSFNKTVIDWDFHSILPQLQ